MRYWNRHKKSWIETISSHDRGYPKKNQTRAQSAYGMIRKELKKFYFYALKSSPEVTIERLRKYAQIKVPFRHSYGHRRKRSFPAYGKCMVCKYYRANHQHHIIQVQNGGPNAYWNRIMICSLCHSKVHPWLEVDESTLTVYRPKEIIEMDNKFINTIQQEETVCNQ